MDGARGNSVENLLHPWARGAGRTPLNRDGRRRCENPHCQAVLASDNPDTRCAPCKGHHQLRPCRVCKGRGTTGQRGLEPCYRCGGSGIAPRRRTP